MLQFSVIKLNFQSIVDDMQQTQHAVFIRSW